MCAPVGSNCLQIQNVPVKVVGKQHPLRMINSMKVIAIAQVGIAQQTSELDLSLILVVEGQEWPKFMAVLAKQGQCFH